MLHFCTFLLNLHFDLEPDYIIKKPMKHRFQLCIVVRKHCQLFTHESNTFLDEQYTDEDWTECAQTDTQTKLKTVYLSVSLRSLGGYNN